MEKITITTGEKIRIARTKAGLSQGELADRLDVTRSLIGQYERGVRNPKPSTLQRIADALGISVTELLPESADQTPEEAVDQFVRARIAEAAKNPGIILDYNPAADMYYFDTRGPVSFDHFAEDFSKRNVLPHLLKAFYRTGNMKALAHAFLMTGTVEALSNEFDALMKELQSFPGNM